MVYVYICECEFVCKCHQVSLQVNKSSDNVQQRYITDHNEWKIKIYVDMMKDMTLNIKRYDSTTMNSELDDLGGRTT